MYKDWVVVVTGSSRGIGRELCEYFLKNGAITIGLSRTRADIEHPRFHHFSVNVGDENLVEEVFRTIRNDYHHIDVLVNCAGVFTSQHALLMPLQSAEEMLRTNMTGTFLVSRICAKIMLQKNFGRIINLTSMAVPLAFIGDALYSASKMAVTQFSKVFAKEIASFNITCNVLGITAFETDMMKKIPKEKLDVIFEQLPIARFLQLEDITNVIDFFIRKESNAITGQVVYLGGVS